MTATGAVKKAGGRDQRSVRIAYHACRILFGAWFLFSGLWHFLWPWLQPLGNTPAAISFTREMLASGLSDWVKAIEVATGALLLADRVLPLVIVAIVPLNVVIVYWNVVLDEGVVEWTFAALTILFNAVLAWPWRRWFWPLFVWKARPDYTLDPGLPPRAG